ncbi:MAG: hypothetical protein U0841_21890 [Chloroflexia bacterium]
MILPLRGGQGPTGSADPAGSRTLSGKFCASCGYGHLGPDATSERCHYCNALLDGSARYFGNLFQLTSVSTRRVNRISSDEEERIRRGYELVTAFRFAASKDGPAVTEAQVSVDGESIATLTYAPTATLWQLNLGWNRRREHSVYGFLLDLEKGNWARQEWDDAAIEGATDGEPQQPSESRVVPFVEDRRNAC